MIEWREPRDPAIAEDSDGNLWTNDEPGTWECQTAPDRPAMPWRTLVETHGRLDVFVWRVTVKA